eukprot:2581476-Prymnesium_polylepis.1
MSLGLQRATPTCWATATDPCEGVCHGRTTGRPLGLQAHAPIWGAKTHSHRTRHVQNKISFAHPWRDR